MVNVWILLLHAIYNALWGHHVRPSVCDQKQTRVTSPCGRYGGNWRIRSIPSVILDLGIEKDKWYATQRGCFISATQWMEGWVGLNAVCSQTRNTQSHSSLPGDSLSVTLFQSLAIRTKGYSEHRKWTVAAVNCNVNIYRTRGYSTVESNVCNRNCTQQSPSWEDKPDLSQSRHFPYFMEPEGALPHSQQPAICPYPEPHQSIERSLSHLLKIHFNIILPSTSKSFRWPLSHKFPHQNSVNTSPLPHMSLSWATSIHWTSPITLIEGSF